MRFSDWPLLWSSNIRRIVAASTPRALVGAAFHRKETATRSDNQVMSHPVACASFCAELAWHRSLRLSGGCGGPHASNLSFQALVFGNAHGRRSNGRCPQRLQGLPHELLKQDRCVRLWWGISRFHRDNASKSIYIRRLDATTEGHRALAGRNHFGYHQVRKLEFLWHQRCNH